MKTYTALTLPLIATIMLGCKSANTTDGPASIEQPNTLPPALLKSLQLTDFQWSVLAQGYLMLVEQEGTWWPAYQTEDALLESYPPQIRLKLHNNDQEQTYFINKLVSPTEISSDEYIAQVQSELGWQNAHDFKLNQVRFEIKLAKESDWQDTEVAKIRFIKK